MKNNKLSRCNVWIVIKIKCKFINFFLHWKIKISLSLRSGIVYKFKSCGCNATYYGKTKRNFKVRLCENLGFGALTGYTSKEQQWIQSNLNGGSFNQQRLPSFKKEQAFAIFPFFCWFRNIIIPHDSRRLIWLYPFDIT